MSKSNRNKPVNWGDYIAGDYLDDYDHGDYYDYESSQQKKKANKRRREDKRNSRFLPCEIEDYSEMETQ